MIKKRLYFTAVEIVNLAASDSVPLYEAQADAIVTAVRENVFVSLSHRGITYTYKPTHLRDAVHILK